MASQVSATSTGTRVLVGVGVDVTKPCVGDAVILAVAVVVGIGLGLLQAERISKIEMVRRTVRFIEFSLASKNCLRESLMMMAVTSG